MSKLGYTCMCGAFHEAGAWGAAHWHIELVHNCKKCGRENVVKDGKILSSGKQVQ